MPDNAKGLNIKCSDWRDQKDFKVAPQQMQQMAKCMAADCVQSFETVGCRFTDANRLCYTDVGQGWCSQHVGHPQCNDLGVSVLAPPAGTSSWTPIEDVALFGSASGDAHYGCTCMKHCTYSSGSKKFRCATGYSKVGVSGSPADTPASIVNDEGKAEDCACFCGKGEEWYKS
ncbi:hypothetical protein GUITHDRAFT_155186 [Guillardia theta CCMP2712]|uniref:Uncharacterized protein n=1 Tax=Guillardia theta (strain CCMP2712) TaxID=905079 RepID=L1IL67_GUITC|nr:hypothetical protein GUITHDRAFT_155186 [Guillardia theta CCMP2712]EKX36649.1 hypothetical protein GUITHDRAFT_155186 [Guillardia theta CCMP2712]|eukprot:XP_005823629.1 hypothetical protein GUITHDRAFT_155186 [Guillardia theta CCMP2712]